MPIIQKTEPMLNPVYFKISGEITHVLYLIRTNCPFLNSSTPAYFCYLLINPLACTSKRFRIRSNHLNKLRNFLSGNLREFSQSFHASEQILFGWFRVEKLKYRHCQLHCHVIKYLWRRKMVNINREMA